MSGIYGIIATNEAPVKKEWLSAMAQSLQHRGPDKQATWIEGSAGLGHLMLYTTPESRYETLPLSYQHWVLTADARLDNRRELFGYLQIPHSDQNTITDGLLILKSYEKWGERCPEYLIGDFAFAIWDKKEKCLFCASDPAGVRQFFYYKDADYFVFSTEIRAITKLDFVPIKLNDGKFQDYLLELWSSTEFKDQTYIKDIYSIRPAHWLRLAHNCLQIENYWKPQTTKTIIFRDKQDYLFELRALIERAIDDRLRTDYPVGVTLSGGLDSSAIAVIAARKLAQRGKTLFSASSVMPLNHTGIEEDDRAYIQLVLDQEKNIKPYFVTPQNKGAFDNLPEVINKTNCPVNSFYYLDDAISKCFQDNTSARVILSGYVGDGTVSNQATQAIYYLSKTGAFKKAWQLSKQRSEVYKKSAFRIFTHDAFLLHLPETLRHFIMRLYQGKPAINLDLDSVCINKNYLSKEKQQIIDAQYKSQYSLKSDFFENIWSPTNTWFDDGEMDVRPSYFQQEDAYPYADRRIIDFLFNIPLEMFQWGGWNRGLFRHAMEGVLPPAIQWRLTKGSYSPDYQHRIAEERIQLVNELMDEKNHLYLNLNKITDKINRTQPAINWADSDSNIYPLVTKGVMANYFLKWLQNVAIIK